MLLKLPNPNIDVVLDICEIVFLFRRTEKERISGKKKDEAVSTVFFPRQVNKMSKFYP